MRSLMNLIAFIKTICMQTESTVNRTSYIFHTHFSADDNFISESEVVSTLPPKNRMHGSSQKSRQTYTEYSIELKH